MLNTLPVGALTVASITLTALVVGNAYYQKKQFYPSVVYITKSNPSLAAIYFLAFTIVILLGKLLKKVFFGQLRAAEFEQLLERSFYAVTETCLAFTVFRDDFSPKFVSLFTVLLFLKAFHYLTDSRVDFMERSPVITMLFHIRVTSLLFLLMMLDFYLLNHSYLTTITHGASVQLVFGFEYAILLTVGFNIAVKYVCHSIDLRSENPWENKAVYLLYTELLVGFVKVVLYVIFLFIMIRIHTFPLFIIRPMYLTTRSFKNALNDVIQSRRAIHNMNTLYPDATAEELAAVDNVCIICREEMTTGAKKLPCGHIFHSSCLRSWFQRQQTCPTCRMNILQQTVPTQQQHGAAAQQQQNAPAQAAGDARVNQPLPNPFAALPFGANPIPPQGLLPQFQFVPQFPLPQNVNEQPTTNASGGTSSGVSTGATGGSTGASGGSTGAVPQNSGFPFGPMPPFLPFMPFSIPPPPPPTNFEGLTLDELRKMEGNERTHVEARIKTLKNIQVLLDAAAIQLSQYNSVVSSLEAQASISSQVEKKLEEAKKKNETAQSVSPSSTDEGDASKRSQTTPSKVPDLEASGSTASPPVGSTENNPENSEITPKSLENDLENCKIAQKTKEKDPDNCEMPQESAENDPDDNSEIRRRRLEKFSGSDVSSS